MLYGKPSESTGTLLSGMFTLEVLENTPFPMKSVHLAIVQEVHTVMPHSGSCENCLNHTTELARWDVLTHPADLPKAAHAYPFSHLIPGSVPAATRNSVFAVSYRLTAVAVPDNGKHTFMDPARPGHRLWFQNFVVNYPLSIKRSIIRGPDRNSVRVFPPTDIAAQVTLPSSVFPGSNFPLEMVLEGIAVCHDENPNRQTRWRLRKINWRIDEEAKIRAFRCPLHQHVPLSKYSSTKVKNLSQPRNTSARHSRPSPRIPPTPSGLLSSAAAALSAVSGSSSHNYSAASSAHGSAAVSVTGSAAPSIPSSPALDPTNPSMPPPPPPPEEFFVEETRTVAAGELKNGWKSDFSGKGKIELLTEIVTEINTVVVDIEDPTFGLYTNHILVVEVVVAEEAVVSKSNQVMPTGAARVLRMQFKLNMTERSGLGIAWDDEVPPTYADVPLSPPTYENVAQLPTLEHVTLEHDQEYTNGIHARLDL